MQNQTEQWEADPVERLATMTVEAAEAYIANCASSDLQQATDVSTACWKHLVSEVGLLSTRETDGLKLSAPNAMSITGEQLSGSGRPDAVTVDNALRTGAHPAELPAGELSDSERPSSFELPKSLCGDRYEVLEILGQGGFGVVYKARDSRTEQTVALKTMKRCDPRELAFFKSEFRQLQGIAHENLVQLLGLDTDGDDWILAMEYVPGNDFFSHVRPQQVLDEGRLRPAFIQLVQGVAALHRNRRLHRDLKEKNVRVTPAGRVVILDFGLAAELDAKGQTKWTNSSILGTIPYMPPEMFSTEPQSSAAGDIYALGVILYQALTGHLPYAGSLRDIVRSKLQHPPPSPKNMVPEDLADLCELCEELLVHAPQQRPTSESLLTRLQPRHHREIALPDVDQLLGRDVELTALSTAFSETNQGGSTVTFISGPSGIGKSALMETFKSQVAERGAVVLDGRCYEHESVPYKALDPVIDNLVRYLEGLNTAAITPLVPHNVAALVRIFPVLGRLSPFANQAISVPISYGSQELRRRAFAGLRQLLGRLASDRRVVIHIDDMQWGDADSALLISELIRPPQAPRVTWYISHRLEDANGAFLTMLREILERLGIPKTKLDLAPLDLYQTGLLVKQIVGKNRPQLTEAIHRESGGNPYFAAELARFVHSERQTQTEQKLTLDNLIRARAKKLTDDARHLLEVIAVAGRPVSQVDAFVAAEQINDPLTASAQLEAGRFLRGIGSAPELELETYHDRVREAVIADLQPDVLRQHHQRLGLTLETSGRAEVDHLAVHFEAAGLLEKAGHYYHRAGDESAQAVAFEQAASYYRKALDLSVLATDQQRTLHRKWANALADAGRGSEAATAYLSLAEDSPSSDERFELQRLAADQSLLCGDRERGIELLERLNRSVGLPFPKNNEQALNLLGEAQAELGRRGLDYELKDLAEIPADVLRKVDVCAIAGTRYSLINTAHYAFYSTIYIHLALDSGERSRIASALASAGFATTCAGGESIALGEQIIAQGMKLAREEGNSLVTATTELWHAFAAWSDGRWRNALERFESAEATASKGQVLHSTGEVKLRHGMLDCLMFMGNWSEIQSRIPEWLADSYRRGSRMSASMYLVHSYILALAEDRPEKAQELLRQAREIWPQSQDMILTFWGHFASVETMLYQGRTADACENIRQNSERVGQYTMFESMQTLALWFYHLRGRTALARARDELDAGSDCWRISVSAVKQDIDRIRQRNASWATPLAGLLEAGLVHLCGEKAKSVEMLADAERGLAAAEQMMLSAAARWQRGKLVGGPSGDELLREAFQFMTAEGVVSPQRIANLFVPGFSN